MSVLARNPYTAFPTLGAGPRGDLQATKVSKVLRAPYAVIGGAVTWLDLVPWKPP